MKPNERLSAGQVIPDRTETARSVYTSADLFRGRSCICIDHGSERYLLRQTRQGKLILTK